MSPVAPSATAAPVTTVAPVTLEAPSVPKAPPVPEAPAAPAAPADPTVCLYPNLSRVDPDDKQTVRDLATAETGTQPDTGQTGNVTLEHSWMDEHKVLTEQHADIELEDKKLAVTDLVRSPFNYPDMPVPDGVDMTRFDVKPSTSPIYRPIPFSTVYCRSSHYFRPYTPFQPL